MQMKLHGRDGQLFAEGSHGVRLHGKYGGPVSGVRGAVASDISGYNRAAARLASSLRSLLFSTTCPNKPSPFIFSAVYDRPFDD